MSFSKAHVLALGRRHAGVATAVAALGALGGCASLNFDATLAQTNAELAPFTQQHLAQHKPGAQGQQSVAERAQALLAAPLSRDHAVQLALVQSPAVQALLAQSLSDALQVAQAAHIANPVFAFERIRAGTELELGRMLALGLWDLITLPQRRDLAQAAVAEARARLASDVVDHVTMVRQAWVRAVAAQQAKHYAQQVAESAEASAELAQRMQAAGNFNKLARARQHAFYADAVAQQALADHAALSAREALVRALGLDGAQAEQLKLPERLPDLPKEALSPQAVSQASRAARLDIKLAEASLNTIAMQQGLTRLTSFTDIELAARRNTVIDTDHRSRPRGFEVSVRLPLFDWGDLQRSASHAQTRAAMHRLDATARAAGSHLRESYSAYRTAYDLARHQRDEVLPLRKTIADENLLRYNGMLIGVFELMADARDQVATVVATLRAQEQFWLADAALQASIIGRPLLATSASGAMAAPAKASSGEGAAH